MFLKKSTRAGCRWLTLIILATQGAEIKRIEVQSQPRQIVLDTLSPKKPTTKRAGGVAQGVSPEFKPQYYKNILESTGENAEVQGR
jgi:hypothetical protein